jgi:hypothetical protein
LRIADYIEHTEEQKHFKNCRTSFAAVCSIMSSGPPPGIDLNADIKQTVISPVIALMVLSAASVALRIVSKLSAKITPQLDDYFILVALVRIPLDVGLFNC